MALQQEVEALVKTLKVAGGALSVGRDVAVKQITKALRDAGLTTLADAPEVREEIKAQAANWSPASVAAITGKASVDLDVSAKTAQEIIFDAKKIMANALWDSLAADGDYRDDLTVPAAKAAIKGARLFLRRSFDATADVSAISAFRQFCQSALGYSITPAWDVGAGVRLNPASYRAFDSNRFELLSIAVAERALKAQGIESPTQEQITVVAKSLQAEAGLIKKGRASTFDDGRWATQADIDAGAKGASIRVRTLDQHPAVIAIAASVAQGKSPTPAECSREFATAKAANKFVYGRAIAERTVEAVAAPALDAAVRVFTEAMTPNISIATPHLAERNVSRAAAKVEYKVSKTLQHSIELALNRALLNQIATDKELVDGVRGKIALNSFTAKLADPVGRDYMQVLIQGALLEHTAGLDQHGWEKSLTSLPGVIAEKVATEFAAFNPHDPASVAHAIERKQQIEKAMLAKKENYAKAMEAVDKVLIGVDVDGKYVDGLRADFRKFNLQSNVRKYLIEKLAAELTNDPSLDLTAAMKALREEIVERGNANKTLKFAHFDTKGIRAKTYAEFFERKASQAYAYFKKLFSGRFGKDDTKGFDAMLAGALTTAKTGKRPAKNYTMHRDANKILAQAINQFNGWEPGSEVEKDGKKYRKIAVSDDVRKALAEQIANALERARVEGRTLPIDTLVEALQPGLAKLALRERDKDGVITAKSAQTSTEPDRDQAGNVVRAKGEPVHSATSLTTLCRDIVATRSADGMASVTEYGTTLKQATTIVMKEVLKNHPGCDSKILKALEKAVATELDKSLYSLTPALLDSIITSATAAIQKTTTPAVTDDKGKVTTPAKSSWSFNAGGFSKAAAGIIDRNNTEQKRIIESFTETQYASLAGGLSSGRGLLASLDRDRMVAVNVEGADRADPGLLIARVNAGVAFIETLVKHGRATGPSEEVAIALINDPKNADLILSGVFGGQDLVTFLNAQAGGGGMHSYARGRPALVTDKVIEAATVRFAELNAAASVAPSIPVTDVAKHLDLLKQAGFAVPSDKFEAALRALANNEARVAQFDGKPAVIEGDSAKISAIQELIVLADAYKGEPTLSFMQLMQNIMRKNDLTVEAGGGYKVNGSSLDDFLRAAKLPTLAQVQTTMKGEVRGRMVAGIKTAAQEREAERLAAIAPVQEAISRMRPDELASLHGLTPAAAAAAAAAGRGLTEAVRGRSASTAPDPVSPRGGSPATRRGSDPLTATLRAGSGTGRGGEGRA
jgi:hypothetical protein